MMISGEFTVVNGPLVTKVRGVNHGADETKVEVVVNRVEIDPNPGSVTTLSITKFTINTLTGHVTMETDDDNDQ